ncbi:MAG: hypothetical protein COB20_07040 [SAR86 cluster bacterium]|uniref:DUF3426 domain-containing protein n=1 Tax=SAR86 cluster bacterium TaxID=2030880 RepID=A0A2A4X6Z4_9GAMM|nr:MAG: hypothetical protein COB20_07040 [SAR86 cluster bacterium]
MGALSKGLLKIVSGFLYGIGFVLAISIGSYFVITQIESEFEIDELGETYTSIDYVRFDESANLEVVIDSEEITDTEFNLLGQISNNGETDWSSISLKAILFDESGKFLDQCEHYHRGMLAAGESNYFKMSCGSQCSVVALENYARYELEVIDASNF